MGIRPQATVSLIVNSKDDDLWAKEKIPVEAFRMMQNHGRTSSGRLEPKARGEFEGSIRTFWSDADGGRENA